MYRRPTAHAATQRRPEHEWGEGAGRGPIVFPEYPDEPRGARPRRFAVELARHRAIEQKHLNLVCNASLAAVLAKKKRHGRRERHECSPCRHRNPFLLSDPRRSHLSQQRALLRVAPLDGSTGLQVPSPELRGLEQIPIGTLVRRRTTEEQRANLLCNA